MPCDQGQKLWRTRHISAPPHSRTPSPPPHHVYLSGSCVLHPGSSLLWRCLVSGCCLSQSLRGCFLRHRAGGRCGPVPILCGASLSLECASLILVAHLSSLHGSSQQPNRACALLRGASASQARPGLHSGLASSASLPGDGANGELRVPRHSSSPHHGLPQERHRRGQRRGRHHVVALLVLS